MESFSPALQGIYDQVADLRVVPLPPPTKTPVIPDSETITIAPPDPAPCSSFGLFIHYEDSDGAHSWRRVVCRRVDLGTAPMIHAFCLERRAFRMFRVDQVHEAVALETGEVLDCAALVADLEARGLPIDDSRLGKVLTALTFLMRCDNETHALERDAIEAAIAAFVMRFECADRIYDEGLKLVGSLAPDGLDFTRSLKWMSRAADAPKVARFLIQHASAVVDADGRHTDEEVRFGAEVGELLKKLAVR